MKVDKTFRQLVEELNDEIRGGFLLEDLQAQDQHRLKQAFIIENPVTVEAIFSETDENSMAHFLGNLSISIEECDVYGLANDLRNAVNHSPNLVDLVDGEIEYQLREINREKQIMKAEAVYDESIGH